VVVLVTGAQALSELSYAAGGGILRRLPLDGSILVIHLFILRFPPGLIKIPRPIHPEVRRSGRRFCRVV
jgi:hypothetical protein